MSEQVAPSHHVTTISGIPDPRVDDPGTGADPKELPVAVGHEDAEDESTDRLPKLSKSRSLLLTAVISTAGLLTVLNVQSVVILPPSMSLILLWDRLADVYDRRLVFLIGSVLFTLSNLCLPFTSGTAVIPSGIGIIASTLPRGNARNNAHVCISAVASVGSVLGNIFGGVIGGMLSRQWVFWIPAILAAVTTATAYFITNTPHLRSSPSAGAHRQLTMLWKAVHGQCDRLVDALDPASYGGSYRDYLDLSELDAALRFLPAGSAGCRNTHDVVCCI
ncbi:MFS general substrate transporter [Colletotrichum caudatum]|nr:MFS general substrate transporter [Colletotrichum caudatum]